MMGKCRCGFLFTLIVIFLMGLFPGLPAVAQVNQSSAQDYEGTKKEILKKQAAFQDRYNQAVAEEEKAGIIGDVRSYLFETLTGRIFPEWYGTPWDFNGATRIPRQGSIARGFFVVFTLQDAGFRIPDRMARQPSENIIRNLTAGENIMRFSNSAPMEKVAAWIRSRGEGLYIVGLDIHVGYVIYQSGLMTFCHSNYYDPPRQVVCQDIFENSPLTDSGYRVLGKILDDPMVIKWIEGERIPVVHDYFAHQPAIAAATSAEIPRNTFRDDQLRYERVRTAYAEKEEAVRTYFREAAVPYPPEKIYIRIFKQENSLELWGWSPAEGAYRLVKTYEVCNWPGNKGPASGTLGPKRREGDCQIPEGFYRVSGFNPASSFYLSLRVNYPNRSDRILGVHRNLGGDIFIHGSCVTIGCIPIQDENIKELYLAAVEVRTMGQETIPVQIFPTRLDDEGMAALADRYQESPRLVAFWRNLKEGYDFFERERRLPNIRVDDLGIHHFSE